ncbi:MAG: hypothetical protein LQ338_004768 [Usnochroma carphineum]|nr:MAG: hypothetical protein LQ338_004768 [Usnochroma carphineum]
MPKATKQKRNGAANSSPYASTKPKSSNHIFKMNTDIGQHVLKNPGVAQAIVDKADLKQSDVRSPVPLPDCPSPPSSTILSARLTLLFKIVLEVGPGSGNLTVKILEKAKKVIAVELDPRMAAEVTKRVQGKPEAKRLEVLLGDVIKTDLPYFDVCISNTPYQVHNPSSPSSSSFFLSLAQTTKQEHPHPSNNESGDSQISSPLTFKLLSLPHPPRLSILTFQSEFASRLLAPPSSPLYSRLSVNAQMYAHVTHVLKVGRNNFKPPPQVDSSVVKLVPKSPRPGIRFEEWDAMLRVCFGRKNRTLRAGWLGARKVLEWVEGCWRGWCGALHDIPVDEGEEGMDAGNEVEEEQQQEEWDGIMDVDDDDGGDDDLLPDPFEQKVLPVTNGVGRRRKKKGKVAELVREKVRKVLEDDTGLADRRARTLDQNDFLRLLLAFNKEGIHFG